MPMAALPGAPSVADLQRELGDGIEVVGLLGRGAGAAVYRVRRHGVAYALKLLMHPDGDDREGSAFQREAGLLARVDHPGVPRVYHVGEVGGRPYMIMELFDGRPLATLLEQGPLDETTLVRVATDVAAALAAAHRAGLVHRDVKPGNIVVMPDGGVRVIDFGLAARGSAPIDDEAVVAGTFEYSAPEQTGM